MATGPDHAGAASPPADPPEKEERPSQPPAEEVFPRWALWFPVAALCAGLAFAFVTVGMLAAVLDATGVDTTGDSPGLTAAGTTVVDLCVVGASLMIAGIAARPRAWQFGFTRAPLGSTAVIAGIGIFTFFMFSLIYGVIVKPKSPQDVVESLGADTNTVLLVTGALVVIVVAPVCEELFFRGFLFRVLRMRMPLFAAALIDGVVFGAVHGASTSVAALPILAFLGIVFCYVYERTGTLFATIALHALNNTISYGVTTDDGWVAALSVGGAMLALCAFGVVKAPRTAVTQGASLRTG